MSGGRPKVSIVVPTLNAGPDLEELLDAISAQEADFGVEVLIVDSGSTDGTRELARRHGASVHRISRETFNHGGTRNRGIALAAGDYVALTVQDAVPLDRRWLATMVEELERDERVAGVYGRQVPRPDCRAVTRAVVNGRMTASPDRREQTTDSVDGYGSLSPIERRELAVFDNVNSCVRRSVWELIPFDEAEFAEDLRWGKKAIEAGYTLVYEPRAAVLHSHERGAMYDLRRHYVDQVALRELFGVEPVSSVRGLALAIVASARRHYRLLRRQQSDGRASRLVLAALGHAVPTQIGGYLAAREPALRRLSPRAFGSMHRALSRGT